jgi:hypothetical protein
VRLTAIGACIALLTSLGCGSADYAMDTPELTELSHTPTVAGQDSVARRKPVSSTPEARSDSRAIPR